MGPVERIRGLADATRNLGVFNAGHYAAKRVLSAVRPGHDFTVRSKYSAHSLWCRAGSSDVAVFGQIFVHREYRCLDGIDEAALIVDCGANAGFSSAYFLSRFPRAQVVAIEPEPGNFGALQRNVCAFGQRVACIQKGVWSRSVGLVISDVPFGDGREWAYTVREAAAGEEPTLAALSLPEVLQNRQVDILKIDIEGAERQVFEGDCSWLRQVKNLVIELHGAECRRSFAAAIEGFGYDVSECDELTVCLTRG